MNTPVKFLTTTAILVATASFGVAAPAPTIVNIDLLNGPKLPLAIKVDTTAAKAGRFNFRIANQSKLTSQGLVVAELKSTGIKDLDDLKNGVIDIKKFKRVLEVDGVKAGDHFSVKTKLKAGDYVLLFKEAGNFQSAMSDPLVVSN
jgi:hypothetical protein